jgi:hypothetical protein
LAGLEIVGTFEKIWALPSVWIQNKVDLLEVTGTSIGLNVSHQIQLSLKTTLFFCASSFTGTLGIGQYVNGYTSRKLYGF